MLEREYEIKGATSCSLWQERYNPVTRERLWHNVVTQKEVFEEPSQIKGAILADDVSDRLPRASC
jgi:SWI/SNF-related matrix-associated actin-dependent regulator of chromatin subfamily A3